MTRPSPRYDQNQPLPAMPGSCETWRDGEIVAFQCRSCSWQSPWFDARDRAVRAYDGDHTEATGHRQFWTYTMSRRASTVEILRRGTA